MNQRINELITDFALHLPFSFCAVRTHNVSTELFALMPMRVSTSGNLV